MKEDGGQLSMLSLTPSVFSALVLNSCPLQQSVIQRRVFESRCRSRPQMEAYSCQSELSLHLVFLQLCASDSSYHPPDLAQASQNHWAVQQLEDLRVKQARSQEEDQVS